jgi:hypothetical protein
MPDLLRKSLRLKKSTLTPISSGIKETNEECETNPFLDCSSSEIDIQSYLFNQNTSMEVEFSTLTNSWKGQENTLCNLQKKMSSPEKGLTSLKEMEMQEKGREKEKQAPVGRYSMKSPKSVSMKSSLMRLSKVSEPSHLKPTQKLPKTQTAHKQLPP